MVTPQDFCNGLLAAKVIERICDLWETNVATIETEDGDRVVIGSKASWERWLYKAVSPDASKKLLLGIRYRELMGEGAIAA